MFPRLPHLCCTLVFTLAAHAADPHAAPGVPPDAALARLRDGNARYRSGAPERPHQDAARRTETAAHGQQPFAVLLSCADSRVPPEVVFDQGVGDLFVIRVAGNTAGVNETATVEYGAEHLGAALCVVLGHTGCGAVTAAVDGGPLHGNLATLIGAVAPAAVRAKKSGPMLAGAPLLAAAIEANVWLAIENLLGRSEPLRALVTGGKLRVVGAVYDLATGEVRWLGAHPGQARLLAPVKAEPLRE